MQRKAALAVYSEQYSTGNSPTNTGGSDYQPFLSPSLHAFGIRRQMGMAPFWLTPITENGFSMVSIANTPAGDYREPAARSIADFGNPAASGHG
ncbi:hypothetical protein LN650_01805 [Klebsiella pneumoniae subsp. pneumoniae]|nr:hypothetical protein [Klebsiella pneumoniae subsp. pneumoniae]